MIPASPPLHRFLAAAVGFVLAGGLPLPAATPWDEMEGIVREIVVPTFPAREVLVTAFGAEGDGKTDCRPAFAHAIDACAAAGGGRVTLPAGTFFCDGPIRLRSHIDLHLAKGAILLFGADPARYLPLVPTRCEGMLQYGLSPPIYANGETDLAVTGSGVIDGNARALLPLLLTAASAGSFEELHRMAEAGLPVAQRVFGSGRWLRPCLLETYECTNLLIEGVTLRDSTAWAVHPVFCRNVTVRGVQVDSLHPHNDGCDPDSCAGVLIEDCRFRVGDDGIAIKSGRDRDGRTIDRPSEKIVIRRCLLDGRLAGLSFGSEISGGVRSVFAEDCRITSTNAAVYFKANLDRGGQVERVGLRRFAIGEVREAAIRFENGYHGYHGGHFPPNFHDILIEDVACGRSAAYGLFLHGVPAAPLRDILVRRLTVAEAPVPLWLRDADRTRLESVEVAGVPLPLDPSPSPEAARFLPISK